MRALFAALDVRWLVITEDLDKGGNASASPWGKHSDLFPVHHDIPGDQLARTLRTVTRTARRYGRSQVPRMASAPHGTTSVKSDGGAKHSNRFILIGASTGGVDALLNVLSSFPADCPPTFIVQHTGGGFGDSLTRLLDRQCAASVRPARSGDLVGSGQVVLAAGCRAHMQLAGGRPMRILLDANGPISGHMPSVDALFQSAVPGARRAVAALLTGMGRDGAVGLKALHDSGAVTIAQDEATSTVYGMPRAAAELGAVQHVLPLHKIGPALLDACAAASSCPNQRVIQS